MQQIIFFDGYCHLCNYSVQFIIKRDPFGKFKFCPLQSKMAENLMAQYKIKDVNFNSIILLQGQESYFRSTAALKISKELNKAWPLLYIFIILPPFIRDFVYRLIARFRYKIFGKSESCLMPSEKLKERLLTDDSS